MRLFCVVNMLSTRVTRYCHLKKSEYFTMLSECLCLLICCSLYGNT